MKSASHITKKPVLIPCRGWQVKSLFSPHTVWIQIWALPFTDEWRSMLFAIYISALEPHTFLTYWNHFHPKKGQGIASTMKDVHSPYCVKGCVTQPLRCKRGTRSGITTWPGIAFLGLAGNILSPSFGELKVGLGAGHFSGSFPLLIYLLHSATPSSLHFS